MFAQISVQRDNRDGSEGHFLFETNLHSQGAHPEAPIEENENDIAVHQRKHCSKVFIQNEFWDIDQDFFSVDYASRVSMKRTWSTLALESSRERVGAKHFFIWQQISHKAKPFNPLR